MWWAYESGSFYLCNYFSSTYLGDSFTLLAPLELLPQGSTACFCHPLSNVNKTNLPTYLPRYLTFPNPTSPLPRLAFPQCVFLPQRQSQDDCKCSLISSYFFI